MWGVPGRVRRRRPPEALAKTHPCRRGRPGTYDGEWLHGGPRTPCGARTRLGNQARKARTGLPCLFQRWGASAPLGGGGCSPPRQPARGSAGGRGSALGGCGKPQDAWGGLTVLGVKPDGLAGEPGGHLGGHGPRGMVQPYWTSHGAHGHTVGNPQWAVSCKGGKGLGGKGLECKC